MERCPFQSIRFCFEVLHAGNSAYRDGNRLCFCIQKPKYNKFGAIRRITQNKVKKVKALWRLMIEGMFYNQLDCSLD
jgi:hypothetical protein